jgi:hypothetical protein
MILNDYHGILLGLGYHVGIDPVRPDTWLV